MTDHVPLLAFLAGLVIAVVTSPVGVSGAVFLLPVQLSLLGVPSPAVTPTNLLFNVVAGPGALLRHRRRGTLAGRLTALLLIGTVPGVVAGAAVRVFAVPGPEVFRVLVAVLLLPMGGWLCLRTLRPTAAPGHDPATPVPASTARGMSDRAVVAAALAVGAAGGIYGIGGGSLIGPLLVGRGMPVGRVAPAALAATFVTSVVGAGSYALLALAASGDVAPHWLVGLSSGLGGLIGGYLGAAVQPRLPERGLRLLLGGLAVAVGAGYAIAVARGVGH